MAGGGSMQKTGVNSWKLTVSGGFDGAGNRIRHTKTVKCTSEQQAKKELALFVAEIDKGNTATAGKLKLSDFCTIWLRDHAERNLALKTVQRYKQYIHHQILPALGHIQLSKLKPPQILAFYAILEKEGLRKDGKSGGLSPRTRLHIHRLLHTILETAVHWEYLNTNPASKIKAPRAHKSEVKILDEEQTTAFIQCLNESAPLKWKTVALLTLAAGLRLSETMGIEWKHIDLDKGTLLIDQSSHYINRVGIITKDTKNKSSERLISLPDSIIELLKQYRAHQNSERLKLGNKWEGAEKTDDDFIFTQWSGKPMYPSSFNTWLRKFCTATCHTLPLTAYGICQRPY